jgi:hypothetical protein
MHSAIRIVQCRYFGNDLLCPYEELGCKFLHDSDIQENNTTSNTSEITTGSRSTVMSCSEQTEDSFDYVNLQLCHSQLG